ncbi:hypothetical protein D3C72_1713310 [compost metagenome]
MVPGHHLGRHLTAIARPDGHRREQVDDVDLAGNERLNHLCPTAQQHGAFSLDAFGFEQAVVVRHQQRGGVSDRQVADTHRRIRVAGRTGLQTAQQRHGATGSQQGTEFDEITTRVGEVVQAHGQSPTAAAKVQK